MIPLLRATTLLAFLLSTLARAETARDFLGDPLPEGAIARLGLPPSESARERVQAWSAEGRFIVVLRLDGIVQTIETSTGRRFATRRLRAEKSIAFGLSRDGTRAALADGSKVRVFDTFSGRLMSTITFAAECLELSSDGRLLAAGTSKGVYGVWNLDSGERIFKGEPVDEDSKGWRPEIRFSGDERFLFTRDSDGTTVESQLADGKEVARTTQRISAFSPDGKSATMPERDECRIVSLPDLTEIGILKTGLYCDNESPVFSPDGHRLYFQMRGIQEFDLETMKMTWESKEDSRDARLAISSDGRFLAVDGSGDNLVWYDLATKERAGEFTLSGGRASVLGFSPDGECLAIGDARHSSTLVRILTGDTTPVASRIGEPEWVAWSPDGKTLAWGSRLDVLLQDTGSGETSRDVPDSKGCSSGAWSPDGARLALGGGWKHAPRIVDLATLQSVPAFKDFAGQSPIAWSPDGVWIATGFADRKAALWDAATAVRLREFRFHAEDVSCLTFRTSPSRYLGEDLIRFSKR